MPEPRAKGPVAGQSVQEVLDDPTASFPLKTVLRGWMERDRIDAANDARLLCEVLEARADAAFRRPA